MNYFLSLLVVLPLVLKQASACYRCGVAYADPHIQTFDKNKFQCQGQGDFILSKDRKSDFELQGRFFVPETGLHTGRNGSSTVAAVLNTGIGNEAKIEVQVTPAGFPASSEHDCDIHYYVNGVRKEMNNWDVVDPKHRYLFKRRTRFHINRFTGRPYPIPFRQFFMYDSKVILWMSKAFDPVFGCYMNLQMCVPCGFERNRDFVGLFGTPDGKKGNDFVDKDGKRINKPPKLGQETTYCRENYCVGEQENSMFLQPDIREMCASDPDDKLEQAIDELDDETKAECEGEIDCLTDTAVTGDVEIGKKTLEGERDLEENDIEDETEPTENDKVEEDDAYTCTKAGVDSETAFARPDDGSGCFLDDTSENFNRWGWSIEMSGDLSAPKEFDIYAAAGQCQTSKGELVGTLKVTYDASSKKCTGEYTASGGYTIQEVQFYCGPSKYPVMKNGKNTVAPGSYPCVQTDTVSPTEDVCEVEDVEPEGGKLYVIAHAVSCDPVETNAPDTPPPTTAPTSAPTDATLPPTHAPTEPERECPEEMPAFNDGCTFEGRCEYGTTTCCNGDTHPKFVFECSEEGIARGFENDACMNVSCEESEPRRAPPREKRGSGSGDPHFKTWHGEKYDYHGECDLVLVDHPEFAKGLGLRVHIRTTRVKYFSFIEKVALQIGNDILEFDNDVENFMINGAPVEANRKHHKTMLGDYVIRRDKKAISVRLHDEGAASKHDHSVAKIDFHTRKNGFPAVIVDGGNTDIFKGSLGLLGDWSTGRALARDGVTEIALSKHDASEFALEWQVRDYDPILFKDARFPQYPQVCTPPAKHMANRLGTKSFEKEAEEACAHWKDDKEDCIFDVIATRDVLVAEEGHIRHVVS